MLILNIYKTKPDMNKSKNLTTFCSLLQNNFNSPLIIQVMKRQNFYFIQNDLW